LKSYLSRAKAATGRRRRTLSERRPLERVELLSDFLEAIPDAEVHVVRNMYLGTEKQFELYNGSKMRAAIEKGGGRSLNSDRVTDAMNKGRLTIPKAASELPLGDRMELERWRDECRTILSEVVGE
jgi:hypothetical protein